MSEENEVSTAVESLSLADVKNALPKHLHTSVTQSLTDKLNNASTDYLAARNIRENFVSFSGILAEGRFKVESYLDAVKYVSYKLMGLTNEKAYIKTFPDRYQRLAEEQKLGDLSSYVSAYHKGKLVNMIMEQALIPSWVLNQDAYQEAINKQLDLMRNAQSEKVQQDAANSILTHLKRPETKEVNVNLGVKEDEGMKALKGMLNDLAEKQISSINNGVPTKEITDQSIQDAEYDEVEE